MEVTMTGQPRVWTRKPLAALGKLTAIALVGIAAMLGYAEAVLIGGFDPMVTGFAVVLLIVAGVIAVGWRWAPALGALVSLLLAGGLILPAAAGVAYTLSHPGDFNEFVMIVIILPLLAVAVAAGIGATVQNYRGGARRSPRWLAADLSLLGGLIIGAILVAGVSQTGAGAAGVSPEMLAGLPALTTAAFEFDQPTIHAKVGETVALRLDNRDSAGHSFDVDELNVHAPMPVGKSGLALFKPTKPGTYTFYCVLHYDKASGAGMKGTLIVEP